MKKLFLMLLASVSLAVAANAQPGGGGFQRMSPEERAARIHQKLDSAFKIDAKVLANLDTALVALYKTQDARMQEIFQNSDGDREAMRETMTSERKKFSDAQDDMLKAILDKEQYEIWKEKIAPSMRPQRPPGSGGPGSGNK
ncbi:MAG TPA: hypothetical protein VN451_07365 [Chitinophagaceae bacterium]|nr:hypothetical protein [Chitinophagaceae bacterium]